MALQVNTEKQGRHIESLDFVGYVLDDGKGVRFNDEVVTFDEMAEIVDYLRTSDTMTELFEECWAAYKRKGSKKKSLEYWKKLTEDEKKMVLPHINAYVSSRDAKFQKDFERYLRDKTFLDVVYYNNQIIYDPTKESGVDNVYRPSCGGALSWNDYYKCYMYTGYWDGHIADGYTDDNRPDGACVTLNNGRGIVKWNGVNKKWNKV